MRRRPLSTGMGVMLGLACHEGIAETNELSSHHLSEMPCAVPGVWGTVPQGDLAQTADAGARGMTTQAAGRQGGGQARPRVSGTGRGSDAATGARQAVGDQGDGQARRSEGDEGQRRREGATPESEGGRRSGREEA